MDSETERLTVRFPRATRHYAITCPAGSLPPHINSALLHKLGAVSGVITAEPMSNIKGIFINADSSDAQQHKYVFNHILAVFGRFDYVLMEETG
jgi:hypothetical protein